MITEKTKTTDSKILEGVKKWLQKTKDFVPNNRESSREWQKAEIRRSKYLLDTGLREEIDKMIDEI